MKSILFINGKILWTMLIGTTVTINVVVVTNVHTTWSELSLSMLPVIKLLKKNIAMLFKEYLQSLQQNLMIPWF